MAGWGDLRGEGSPELVGALATSRDGATLCIERLAVEPRSGRQGVGRRPLTEAVPTTVDVVVPTGRENLSAVRLHVSAGFVQEGEREVLPGMWIRSFRRQSL